MRNRDLDSIRPQLEKRVEAIAEGMGQSAICISIFTDNYKKGIDSLLQFAVAIMLDKPLYLMVPEGTRIPEHVKKIASAIEFYKENDRASFDAAGERLMRLAQEKDLAE